MISDKTDRALSRATLECESWFYMQELYHENTYTLQSTSRFRLIALPSSSTIWLALVNTACLLQ